MNPTPPYTPESKRALPTPGSMDTPLPPGVPTAPRTRLLEPVDPLVDLPPLTPRRVEGHPPAALSHSPGDEAAEAGLPPVAIHTPPPAGDEPVARARSIRGLLGQLRRQRQQAPAEHKGGDPRARRASAPARVALVAAHPRPTEEDIRSAGQALDRLRDEQWRLNAERDRLNAVLADTPSLEGLTILESLQRVRFVGEQPPEIQERLHATQVAVERDRADVEARLRSLARQILQAQEVLRTDPDPA
jgi:hypothetical protein